MIRQNYIRKPASSDVPYHLEDPGWPDPSNGQSEGILKLLRQQVGINFTFK